MKSTEFNLSTALHLAFVQWNGDECTPFDKLLYGEEKCGEWCLKSTMLCVGCSARLNMCRAALSYSIVTCSNIGWLSLDFFLTKISKLGNLNCIHDFKGELQHYKNAGKKTFSMCTRATYYSVARSDRSRSPAVPSIMHRLWRHRPKRQP